MVLHLFGDQTEEAMRNHILRQLSSEEIKQVIEKQFSPYRVKVKSY